MSTMTTSAGKKKQLTPGQRRAADATRRFRSMIPALRLYAGEVLGHEVKVVPGPSTQTDGKTIWLRPPSELAYELHHTMCGHYGEDGLSLCSGCKVIDNIILYLHHEISHIMHGSFEEYLFGTGLYMEVHNKICQHLHYTLHPEQTWDCTFREEGTLMIASMVYPPLTAVLQALEDHRINEAHYRDDRDDLRQQMKTDSQGIIDKGIIQTDGSSVSWGDAGKDAQMMIQMLFHLQGNETEHVLSQEVLDDFEELEIADMIQGTADCADAKELMFLAAGVTGKCMTKGYFKHDTDLEQLLELLRALFGHGICDKLAEGQMMGRAKPNDKKSQEEEEFTDGLRETLLAGQHLEGAPLNISGLTVSQYPKGQAFDAGADTTVPASAGARNRAVTKARLVFEKNARVEHQRNQRRGKLNGRVLGKRAWSGDDRLFAQRITPDERKYGVVIGLDISGSTSGSRLEVIKTAALAMADVCHRTGVNFEIYAHTGGMENVKGDPRSAANVYEIKSLTDPWNTKTQNVLKGIGCGGINLDGHTMQFYRKRMDQSGCTDNVLFYFTDGSMPAANYEEELDVLKRELALMKRRGYTVIGVGVDTDSPKAHGLDTVVVHGADDIAAVLDKMASRIG